MANVNTLLHKALFKQLTNLLIESPSTKNKILFHGLGLDILAAIKSTLPRKINTQIDKDLVFMC
jgi:hypothetical protein